MHKLFMALILRSISVSNGALAHSGADQEVKACAPDVQRFCRKLMDQGDRFYHSSLPKGKSPKALCRLSRRAGQPRAMTIGCPFGVGSLSSLNTGFGGGQDSAENARAICS